MNRKVLLDSLDFLISTLVKCGYASNAEWLDERRQALAIGGSAEKEGEIMRQLRSVCLGMGGLNDLPLNPPAGIDAERLRSAFSEQVERLYENCIDMG